MYNTAIEDWEMTEGGGDMIYDIVQPSHLASGSRGEDDTFARAERTRAELREKLISDLGSESTDNDVQLLKFITLQFVLCLITLVSIVIARGAATWGRGICPI